jgi:Helicase conserved C-terminal domain/SNF2-related domain
MTLLVVDAATARAAVARCWLEASGDAEMQLGSVRLRPHQMVAVREIRALLKEFGGALLADEVGLGKTFVALALAAQARRPLVVAPAGLRGMWQHAAARAAARITMYSTEALSRGDAPTSTEGGWDLIIVDEAHHFRNPTTRRYRALGRVTAGVPVVLLSATPIHNQVGDVAVMLELFLGARAKTLSDADRARCIVRRTSSMLVGATSATDTESRVPIVEGPHRMTLTDDRETLAAILALPDAVPPRDGGNAGALVSFGLVRQWASSAGALRAALRRRLARAVALTSALETGRHPSYRDLRAWCIGEGAVQLAFPELLVPPSSEVGALLSAVRTHEAGVRAFLERLVAAPDPDIERAELLRGVIRTHPGTRVVAFSAFEDTVRTLYRHLARRERACVLSAGGAVIASGRMSRSEVMAQFAPAGSRVGGSVAGAAERIDLLLTTDLLSEGVNLQEASVVVHLDLPWTPARLEQRVGRIARLGSAHERVHVYAMTPPASADTLLGVERRLRAKLDAAGRAIGVLGSILPARAAPGDVTASHPSPGPPEQIAATRDVVRRWRAADAGAVGGARESVATVCAAVQADASGWLAACVRDGRPMLLACAGGAVTDTPAAVARAVAFADGHPVPMDESACRAALLLIDEWCGGRRAAGDAGLLVAAATGARRRVLSRIAMIARQAPPHLRPRLATLIRRARRAAVTRCGAGAEWVLDELANAQMADRAWLLAVAAFGDSYGPRNDAEPRIDTAEDSRDEGRVASTGAVVAALILFQRGDVARSGIRRRYGAAGSVFHTAIPPACGPTSIDPTFCNALKSMTSTVPGCDPTPSSDTNT